MGRKKRGKRPVSGLDVKRGLCPEAGLKQPWSLKKKEKKKNNI